MSAALAGRRLLLARPRGRAASLAAALRRLGAEVCELPVLELEPVAPDAAGRAALAAAERMDAVVFVSPAAVARGRELAAARLAAARAYAVGPATAAALAAELGVRATVPAAGVGAEALLAGSPLGRLGRGAEVLIVRGAEGRELLANALRERGVRVHEAVVYRPVTAATDAASLQAHLGDRAPHIMIAASCGAWRALAELLVRAGRGAWRSTPVLLCSERHRACAAAAGFTAVAAVARDPGVAAVVDALSGLGGAADDRG